MSQVNVFIYSYKNKDLIDTLTDMIAKESGNNKIHYTVFDQNNSNSTKLFGGFSNITYNHIYWDDWAYKNYYRSIYLLNKDGYYLEVNDNIRLNDNWDSDLISSIEGKDIISGKGTCKLFIDNCFVRSKHEKSSSMSLTNYVDFDLFFTNIYNCGTLLNLKNIKVAGKELYASVLYSLNKKSIYSMPENFYSILKIDETDYVPFSKYHGYNKMINKIKSLDLNEFENFHGISIKDITEMPYQVDDVSFIKYTANIYNNKARFHEPYSKMEIM
jgi:hypothetical protein